MKYLSSIVFALTLAFSVSGQTTSVGGTITVKEMSGNNLGGFGCSNIQVAASSMNQVRPYSWNLKAAASGDISKKKCSYRINGIRANSNFRVSLTGQFPKGCDLKSFKTDQSFPMKAVAGTPFIYSPTVHEIKCILVK